MFDLVAVRPPTAPAGGASADGPAPGGDRAERTVEDLSAMAPGAAMAAAVEQLLADLMAPREPAPVLSAVPAAQETQEQSGALLARIQDPGERALTRTAAPGCPGEGAVAVETLADLGADVLSELVAACGRLAAWASWAQALMAAALTRCPEMTGRSAAWGPGGAGSRFVTAEEARFTAASEIACRAGMSRTRAGRLVDIGQALASDHLAATGGMHRVGLLDQAKTELIIGRLGGADGQIAAAVQEEVLPRAPHRTHAQVARDLDRSLTALDPEGSGERRRRNTAQRHVSRPRPAGEGMSEMRLMLPVPDAFLLDATLDAVAASARAAGEERSLSQLRADALVSMSLGLLRGAQHRACAGSGAHERSAACSGAGDPVAGRAHHCPRESAGDPAREPAGDRSASPAPDRLLPDGVPLEGLLAELSGLVGSTSPWWTPSGTDPVPLPDGLQVRVNVTVPLDCLVETIEEPPPPRAGAVSGARTGGVSGARAGAVSGAQSGSSPPAGRANEGGPPRCEATVTAGGRSAPVPAVVARALAAGGIWRRIVTDPLTGAILDVGRSRYRPPAALADAVRARDRSCTHPGCEVPARRCDLDHILPWAQGGTTSLTNLTALCEAHHRLKHTPGWSLSRADDGALIWRTPAGIRYRREADGTVIMLARRVGPRHRIDPGGPVSAGLAAAVDDAVLARLERGLEQAKGQTDPAGSDRPRLETHGPRPGERAGDFEAVAYRPALHELGLAPLLDAAIPF